MRRASAATSDARATMVTPLVDILFNMMIAMFVFLMIYMAVVIPAEPNPLRFPDFQLPPASPASPYISNIKVTGGSGRFLYLFGPPDGAATLRRDPASSAISAPDGRQLSRERSAELRIDPNEGILQGRFFAGATGRFEFPVVVVDRAVVADCEGEAVERWGDVQLAFPAGSSGQAAGDATTAVAAGGCHPAIRSSFEIDVRPRAVPHALPPLSLQLPSDLCLTSGSAVSASAAVVGGIEPYEFQKVTGPGWLRIDRSSGRLSGTAPAAGAYQVGIEVKDAQTFSGDWEAARRQQSNATRPYATATFTIAVAPPLAAPVVVLPGFGRVGEAVDGVIASIGGCGVKTFSAALPTGLTLDQRSGRIAGSPTEAGDFDIGVTVTSQSGSSANSSRNAWRVVPRRPAKRLLTPAETP